ncbi:MAG TPA: VOC family protein [Steroidobacteraceae bacterium]|nr:VOC family protein [Steroidobacteraceae bacterium]
MTGSRVKVRRIIHTIHATADMDACRARYLDVLGGLIFAEGYFEAEDRDMALLYVADHMIEPMSPRDPKRLDKPFARYLNRYGPGFHSFEIKVDDGPAVAARLKEGGCKLAAEYGFFFFVRQESTGGVLLEVCDRPMPNDPYERPDFRPAWAGLHASTLRALDHIACVTADASAALAFFTGLLDGELLAEEHITLPQPGRRWVVRLADTRVAFIQPDDSSSGALGAFLRPPTSGIYALVWRVEDPQAAERFFHSKGLSTRRQDCVSAGFAIEPRDFLQARHEFIGA